MSTNNDSNGWFTFALVVMVLVALFLMLGCEPQQESKACAKYPKDVICQQPPRRA